MTEPDDRIASERDTPFLGDSLLWSKYLPRAWREVTGAHSAEPFPEWINTNDEARWALEAHAIFDAYLHLLFFRLGWTSPGLGLLRWHERGRQKGDPVLDFLTRLGGNGLDWFVAWAGTYENRSVPRELTAKFDGTLAGDELGLTEHCFAPGVLPAYPSPTADPLPEGFALVPGSLVSDQYTGWWNALAVGGVEGGDFDVTVKPIGWLGRYALSPATGIPHATTEEIHEMGVDEDAHRALRARLEAIRAAVGAQIPQ